MYDMRSLFLLAYVIYFYGCYYYFFIIYIDVDLLIYLYAHTHMYVLNACHYACLIKVVKFS